MRNEVCSWVSNLRFRIELYRCGAMSSCPLVRAYLRTHRQNPLFFITPGLETADDSFISS
jgi:hypothetical protein